VIDSINAGKNVFVEKPLALCRDDIASIEAAYEQARNSGNSIRLMVGFNRRFAPLVQKLYLEIKKSSTPISVIYTCNAGHVPANTWVQDPKRGGGRIVGEACHFIDLVRFLAGSPIVDIQASGLTLTRAESDCHDTASINIQFENGSLATVLYFANGHPSFPKERIEVFQNGKTLVLNNFRNLKGYGVKGFNDRSFAQDKGQTECCARFVEAIHSGTTAPIAYEELIEVTYATIRAAETLSAN
jgi:predicted dehydrogenase